MKGRFALLLSVLAVQAGCSSLSAKQKTWLGDESESLLHQNVPGLGDLYSDSKEEKQDAKWWDGYYGRKASTGSE